MAILIQPGRRAATACPLLAVAIAGLACAAAAVSPVEEYAVKAAFVFNFAKFVAWPPQAFRAPDEPISICVLGQNPFGNSLENVVRGQSVDGRPIRVRQIAEIPPKTACHILFVSAAEWKRFEPLAGSLKGTATLTVGESAGFAAEGGVIGLKVEGGKVRFEINMDAADQAQLHISAKLLSLAEVVRRNWRPR